MSVPDTILAAIVDALPDGAYLWQREEDVKPPTDDLIVFDGRVPPEPPRRYVVAYIDNGTRNADTVAHDATSRTFRWQVTSVAPDRQMSGWLAERIADHLTDVRFDLPGWAPGLVEHSLSHQPRRDEQVLERPVVYAIDQYTLLADRKPAAA